MKKRLIIIPIIALMTTVIFAQSCNHSENTMIQEARSFLGKPYVANTLETDEKEHLIVNRNEVDCTTFIEYVLAQALTTDNKSAYNNQSFEKNLKLIRYRDGIIEGYPSRLHYITDWIINGIKHKTIIDVTAAHCQYVKSITLSFMSEHSELYKHLKNSPENVKAIKRHEKRLTGTHIHWLPKEELPEKGLPWIQDGDIIALVTSIPGLDVTHMGIACYQKGKLHLLHASSKLKKVVIETVPLQTMLKKSNNWIGIRVLRMRS